MKPERTVAYRELLASSLELGKQFIERWFVPEVWGTETQDPNFLGKVGDTLRIIGQSFSKSDPGWDIPRPEDRLSVFNLYDLDRHAERGNLFGNLWRKIQGTIDKDALYFPKGVTVGIREHDFLVTTPLPKAKEHVKEAEDAIELFERTGEIAYYYRDIWPFPKNLKIGSKFFYVDNRAIRGFAVVTDIDIKGVTVNMDVNTWRWINPIPCNYAKIKPPQTYARAIGHTYLEGINKVQIIGEWLDPMP